MLSWRVGGELVSALAGPAYFIHSLKLISYAS